MLLISIDECGLGSGWGDAYICLSLFYVNEEKKRKERKDDGKNQIELELELKLEGEIEEEELKVKRLSNEELNESTIKTVSSKTHLVKPLQIENLNKEFNFYLDIANKYKKRKDITSLDSKSLSEIQREQIYNFLKKNSIAMSLNEDNLSSHIQKLFSNKQFLESKAFGYFIVKNKLQDIKDKGLYSSLRNTLKEKLSLFLEQVNKYKLTSFGDIEIIIDGEYSLYNLSSDNLTLTSENLPPSNIDSKCILPESHLQVDNSNISECSFINTKVNVSYYTRGDLKYLPIGISSIMAKVERDLTFKDLDPKYNVYDLLNNKGYLTQKHRNAIQKYGKCFYHR